MKVHNCPSCGSEDIDKSSFSAEYMSSITWDCEDCEWFYTQGYGVGTGSGNNGTHPQKLSGGNQQTLTPTGEYHSCCGVVVTGSHKCDDD